jgi:hypothetical protein
MTMKNVKSVKVMEGSYDIIYNNEVVGSVEKFPYGYVTSIYTNGKEYKDLKPTKNESIKSVLNEINQKI